MGVDACNSCNIGKSALADMYAQYPRVCAEAIAGVCVLQYSVGVVTF